MKNLHFTTGLGVRRWLFALRVARRREKFAFHHSFGRPTSTKWREGCLPPRPTKPTLRKRKEEILKRSSIFEGQRSQQLFSADFLSSSSQQLFSAALLSSLSQQLFSAAFLSSLSQQLFSAALLSSFSQQLFSAAFLSSSSQQLFSAAFLSSSSQQIFSAALLSSSSQQLFSAIILLWSGVGGQLVTSSSAALLSYHLAVVRGWWSASNIIFSSSSQLIPSAIILLWSGVGGQVCYRSLEGPFRNAFGKKTDDSWWSYLCHILFWLSPCKQVVFVWSNVVN